MDANKTTNFNLNHIHSQLENQTWSYQETPSIPKTFGVLEMLTFVILPLLFAFLLAIICLLGKLKAQQLSNEDTDEFFNGGDSKSIGRIVKDLNGPYHKNRFELRRKSFTVEENSSLGYGEFGQVFRGTVTAADGLKEKVAVKTTKVPCQRTAFKGLLYEIKILSYLGKHPNIVELVGAYTAEFKQRKVFVFLELCDLGSLETYLRNCNSSGNRLDFEQNGHIEMISGYGVWNSEWKVPPLDEGLVKDMARWSREMAGGMEFIASKDTVHMDLAARNILLTLEKRAKITDFGLSRRMYDHRAYVKTEKDPLPVRWIALESLSRGVFTEKSDVWSFGILLWEIYSLGDTPYPGIPIDSSFFPNLMRGLRMSAPTYNINNIYSVMERCWAANPIERPTFSEMVLILNSEKPFELAINQEDMTTSPAAPEMQNKFDQNFEVKIQAVSHKLRERWAHSRLDVLRYLLVFMLVLMVVAMSILTVCIYKNEQSPRLTSKPVCNGTSCESFLSQLPIHSSTSPSESVSGSCVGKVATTTGNLMIRKSPNSSSPFVGRERIPRGRNFTIIGRETGEEINGNPYWFKVPDGFVSSYFVYIVSKNGDWYCETTGPNSPL